MQKKIDLQDLDYPKDDIDCWERYPKHRWVYDLSRLLDAQHIEWSPFETNTLNIKKVNMYLETTNSLEYDTSHIYTHITTGIHLFTEVYISRGEIKLLRYIDKQTLLDTEEFVGNTELRINAFISMHFQKFTGVITVESVGNDIISVRLRGMLKLQVCTNSEIMRLIKKLYKRIEAMPINTKLTSLEVDTIS